METCESGRTSEQVIALVDLQRGIGSARAVRRGSTTWSRVSPKAATATASTRRWPTHSPTTRALLDRLRRDRRRTRRRRRADRRRRAHGPLTVNMLVDGDAITGVIDWEGSTTGDAAFDLVTHALYTYDPTLRATLARRRTRSYRSRARCRSTPRTWCCARSTGRSATTASPRCEWFARRRHRPVGRGRRWVGSRAMAAIPVLTLHELADGVFVWLQPGGESGVSNAGAVVDDDGDHRDRHAHGAVAVGAVRRRGQRARPPGTSHPADARAHRPRRRHARLPERGRVRLAADESSCSTARCRSTRTSRSCPRSTRSSTCSPSSARVRSRTSSPTAPSSRRASK